MLNKNRPMLTFKKVENVKHHKTKVPTMIGRFKSYVYNMETIH